MNWMDWISSLQAIGASKLRRDRARYLKTIQRSSEPEGTRRENDADGRPGIEASPITVPVRDLTAHGLIAGATGSGKTWAAIGLMQDLQRSGRGRLNIGVVDGKGDLFKRALQTIEPSVLARPDAVICDFSGSTPPAYGLLLRQSGETNEGLVDRRMSVFDDVLGTENQLSLRMSRVLRNVLTVAVEHELGFPMVEFLLARGDICRAIGMQSADERVAGYFQHEFEREQNTTVKAVLARLDFLLRSSALRLSFGSDRVINLQGAIDAGAPVLFNTGGPAIPRQVSRVVQSLLLSDLRHAVFGRQHPSVPFSLFLDEAQTLMSNTADAGNLIDLLTMARSFGAGIVLMTQSIAAASPSREFLQQLETNLRWMVMFRTGLTDAKLIEPGLLTTGNVVKWRHHGGHVTYLTDEQEATERLRAFASLPAHHAYVWSRSGTSPARLVKFPQVSLQQLADPPPLIHVDAGRVHRQLREQEERLRSIANLGNPKNSPRSNRGLGDILARVDQALTGATDGQTN